MIKTSADSAQLSFGYDDNIRKTRVLLMHCDKGNSNPATERLFTLV